ncbi:MAG: hypothetical protein ACLQBB_01810 [Solirubrobacteraceae bacterium]
MSLSAAIAVIVALDVMLIGFLAWMMSHPRHLTPHVSRREQTLDDSPLRQRIVHSSQSARELEPVA